MIIVNVSGTRPAEKGQALGGAKFVVTDFKGNKAMKVVPCIKIRNSENGIPEFVE